MKKIAFSACAAMLVLFCVSCGSKPAPEETKTPEPPKVEVQEPEKVEEKVEEVVVKVDNTAALKSIEDARKNGVDKEVEEYAADELAAADAVYAKIKAKADAGEDVSEDAEDLTNRYAALKLYVSACKALWKIDDTEKESLAQSLYDEGCDALEAYENLCADPNSTGNAQLGQVTKAATALNSALVIVYKQITKDERTDAFVAKKNADSVKAAVSQKAKYEQGVEYFKKGDSLYTMQSLEKAYDNYKSSKEIFEALYNDIAEKRAAIQKAIDEAKRKVNESADFAAQADKTAPLREKVEGIEDEDAVLLDADNYGDPSAAETDLPEEIEDPAKKLIKNVIGDAK